MIRVVLDTNVLVSATAILTICPDQADDRFLECAEAASADYLVTAGE